jgi:hypothetical protein
MMKKLIHKAYPLLVLCSVLLSSCTEPYILQTNTYEEALVIEAIITNELKKQEIKISKTYRLEDLGPEIEHGAKVSVSDNVGNTYEFTEQSGTYISTVEFQAVPDREYQLNIKTKDNKTYRSIKPEKLTAINPIQDLKATVETVDGKRGVQINVSSYDPNALSKYYRYVYEETYKVIAPKWVSDEAIVTGPQTIQIQPRTTEAKTCYGSKKSVIPSLYSTNKLKEDRVDHTIRFISDKDYIIMHRYSIIVKQYIQNLESYNYYKTLEKLSGSSNSLSPEQPGLINGNIKCVENPNAKAIGYFELSSVSSKRIFFNYTDLFPGEPLPPYYTECTPIEYNFCFLPLPPPLSCDGLYIMQQLRSKESVYFAGGSSSSLSLMVPAPCGDCTTISSNIKPSFWID